MNNRNDLSHKMSRVESDRKTRMEISWENFIIQDRSGRGGGGGEKWAYIKAGDREQRQGP